LQTTLNGIHTVGLASSKLTQNVEYVGKDLVRADLRALDTQNADGIAFVTGYEITKYYPLLPTAPSMICRITLSKFGSAQFLHNSCQSLMV